jgi:hypothetical protein
METGSILFLHSRVETARRFVKLMDLKVEPDRRDRECRRDAAAVVLVGGTSVLALLCDKPRHAAVGIRHHPGAGHQR